MPKVQVPHSALAVRGWRPFRIDLLRKWGIELLTVSNRTHFMHFIPRMNAVHGSLLLKTIAANYP
jgi:hypothetical protein